MSKKRIITISRSFGSGGRMIGEELARRLEYHFYDRNLLDLLSEKTGISEQGLESADEKLPQKILDHYVPDEDRIQRIMETEDVTQTQAEKLMVQIDKMRNNYYSYFTDRKWQHTKDRDIIVNSSLLGIEGTVGMLEYIVNASN